MTATRNAEPRVDHPARAGYSPAQRALLGLSLGLGIVFFLLWAGIGFRDMPGDLILYFDYANYVDDGYVLYRDVMIEYPPLALAPMLGAFAVGHSFAAFEAAFAVEMYLLAIAGGALVWWLTGRLSPDASVEERNWRLAAYAAAFPLLGQIVTTRFDLFPTVLMTAALALWIARKEGAAWAVLGAGIAAKLFPVILAPLFLIDLLARRGYRAALTGGLQLAGWCLVWFLPALLASPDGLRRALTYHGQRGMQIESLYANGLLLVNHTTGFRVGTDNVFGAFEAISAWTDELKVISVFVQVLAVCAVYILYAWQSSFTPDPAGATGWAHRLALAATLTVAVFIATGKVFSPQYLIWLMPLVVILPGLTGRRAIAAFLGVLLLTQILFPYAYDTLLDREWLGILLLTARNLLYLALVALLASALVRVTSDEG